MKNFNEVVGHEQVISHLQTAIRQNKVSHAYLINGEKSTGKKLIADIFARTLQCENNEEANPCGICKSCVQAESGNHPDIFWVTHEKVNIGVDDIRNQVNNDIMIKPYSSKYKIYIIQEAEKMTEQAQNAILKTIEEPPEYAILILLTNNKNKLVSTILSRCILLDLKTVNPMLIKKYLIEQCKVPDYLAELSANFSQGNVGRAIRYATSEDFTRIKEDVLHILKYIDNMTVFEIIDGIRNLSNYKLEINDYIDLMMLWYRDVLMLKVTNDPNTLLFKDEYKYLSRQASKKEYSSIENIIKAMDKAKIRLNANVNFETTMELMLLTLKEN